VELAQIIVKLPQFSHMTITPPMLHIHISSIYCYCYTILKRQLCQKHVFPFSISICSYTLLCLLNAVLLKFSRNRTLTFGKE